MSNTNKEKKTTHFRLTLLDAQRITVLHMIVMTKVVLVNLTDFSCW